MGSDSMTMQQVLADHPWPAEHDAAKRIEYFWQFDLPGSAEDLWPLVADTSRMNRALGLSAMKFEDREGVRHGSATNGGVHQEWIEVPWDWVQGQWFTSLRVYERGFARLVYGIYILEPRSASTSRLNVYFGAVPRNLLGSMALRYGIPAIERAYRQVLPQTIPTRVQPIPALLILKAKA